MKRIIFISACSAALVGCMASITEVATTVATATGTITASQAQAINRSAKAVEKTFKDITPEQEYYIGRSVGATIVNKYKVLDSKKATHYLNVLGQTLALASDKPETFNGYHFLILNTDEINAFAAPGGLIFVSKGMLKLCQSEDDLAAVLAHEIGHIQHDHALKAIKTSRITSALTVIATESAKTFANDTIAGLTSTFEGSIDDISQTLVNSGYSRNLESDADKAAINILKRIGYDPSALVRVLQEMKKHMKPDSGGFASTHPAPDDRIADIKDRAGSGQGTATSKTRAKRFQQFLQRI